MDVALGAQRRVDDEGYGEGEENPVDDMHGYKG
jgi:hypothetical protein